MDRVIDAHMHLSESPHDALIPYATRNGLKYDLDELLGMMRQSRVVKGLLLSPPLTSGSPLRNETVLEFCRRSEGLLSPVITVEPSREEVRLAVELAKINRSEVRGFKIRLGYLSVFADDPVFDSLYSYATEEGLPVMFHTGDTANAEGSLEHSHPLTLDRLANKRTDLKIVACHFGNPWMQDVAELIYKHPNVYADISGLVVGNSKYEDGYLQSLADQLTRAIYFAGGADKVIFGSDYPVSVPSMGFTLVKRLKVDSEDLERILWKNATRVFQL